MTQALDSASGAVPDWSSLRAELAAALFDDVRGEWERYYAERSGVAEPQRPPRVSDPEGSGLVAMVRGQVAARLRFDDDCTEPGVDIHTPLADLGIDSMVATEINEALGALLKDDLLGGAVSPAISIVEIATRLAGLGAGIAGAELAADAAAVSGARIAGRASSSAVWRATP